MNDTAHYVLLAIVVLVTYFRGYVDGIKDERETKRTKRK